MTNISKLTDSFSVAGQLEQDDFTKIYDAGFRTVVNFRPDGEKFGYINANDAKKCAKAAGLKYFYIPVTMNGLSPEPAVKLNTILSETKAPVLAHCGTGRRAAMVWALASAKSGDVNEIINCCAKAGHDISPLRPHLENMK